MRRLTILGAIAIAALPSGCGLLDSDEPRDYFAKHKSGTGADFGIMKFGDDHVATVHGFVDDLEVCQQIVDAMNKSACEETGGTGCLNPFSCKPLNH